MLPHWQRATVGHHELTTKALPPPPPRENHQRPNRSNFQQRDANPSLAIAFGSQIPIKFNSIRMQNPITNDDRLNDAAADWPSVYPPNTHPSWGLMGPRGAGGGKRADLLASPPPPPHAFAPLTDCAVCAMPICQLLESFEDCCVSLDNCGCH